ncbi:DUF364 domain-containing protein [Desulfoluna butyratoxydans]|uniref:Putative heavy-metal chelation n=1 Tax=Desulfoluna butyratoxydans TaxID=231438 RepID=A0A4U8YLK2_9BACT|nr:DUF364 domain-containing protein [Desulfoluna butyratoxydans]VFQ44029.1 putative heavy-metal chelation [Desulfoluna butyratoxydans]
MQLIRNLSAHFSDKASRTIVTSVTIGLKYTAVTTDDGGIGLAWTDPSSLGCGKAGEYRDFEGLPATELLDLLQSGVPLHRTMALALVNALNYHEACGYPEDAGDGGWMDSFAIGPETRVAMVGFFRPLMKKFTARGASVEVLDDTQGVGDRPSFLQKLNGWAEVLLLTSTSILNRSTEELLAQLPRDMTRVIMLGPSTPVVPAAFAHLPVRILAGTVPEDQAAVVRAVRHGQGTPVIHRFSRKVCAPCSPSVHPG